MFKNIHIPYCCFIIMTIIIMICGLKACWSVGVQGTFYHMSPFPRRSFPTVVIMLIGWAKSPQGPTNNLPHVSFSKPVFSYCGYHVHWISFVFLMVVVSAPIRPTLLMYPDLELGFECIGFYAPCLSV